MRAYYASLDGTPREISYRSTFKQSRRTVAKPIVSRSTGKTVYWEHKAVYLRFEQFGEAWALTLLPGYVFTLDGETRPIASEKIGPLSTRRAARDYNPTVLHDLVFWSRMLADGHDDLVFVHALNDAILFHGAFDLWREGIDVGLGGESIDGGTIAWMIFMVGLRFGSLLDQHEVLMNDHTRLG